MDHLGHLGVNSIIRLGKAYEKFNLSWMEDVIPWQYTEMLEHITAESPTPILTGEDIYLKEGFIKLCEKHAVSKIHPDISTSGGILETHKIGEAAMELGVPMAMHYAGTPVGAMASVHCAAATANFLACENHSLDVPWWAGPGGRHRASPSSIKGWIAVPDKPGLGITLNEDVVQQASGARHRLLRAHPAMGPGALGRLAVELTQRQEFREDDSQIPINDPLRGCLDGVRAGAGGQGATVDLDQRPTGGVHQGLDRRPVPGRAAQGPRRVAGTG